MRTKFYLNLLILSVILCQEIRALLEMNITKIRKKRIIDYWPNGNMPVLIQTVPYIVNLRANGFSLCGGVIVSSNIVLTAGHCVFQKNLYYTILSGSAYRDQGILHNIKRILFHPHFTIRNFENDFAMLFITPPIDLIHSPNRKIELHDGHVEPNTFAVLSGWGCTRKNKAGKMTFPEELRSITLPVISESECRTIDESYIPLITIRDICTLDRTRRTSSCDGDSGGPLVLNEKLIGILTWKKAVAPQLLPDVFLNMTHPAYRNWVNLHVPRNEM